MELYLIRHTTPDISKGICYGQSDINVLASKFIEETERIKFKLPNDIELFITSPLKRCSELAAALTGHYIIDERLKELNFGTWELKAWQDIADGELQPWMNDFVNCSTPLGESYIQLHQRCVAFLQEIVLRPYKKVAIVTHAGNIRSMISYVLDLPLNKSFKVDIPYGALVKLYVFEDNQLSKIDITL